MSIQSASIDKDGVISSTGGTATSLLVMDVGNGVLECILNDSSEFVNRTTLTFKAKQPKVSSSAPNGYTQARSEVKIQRNLALDNGNSTINSAGLHISVDHETTDAEIASLLNLIGQLVLDADFQAFFYQQSLS